MIDQPPSPPAEVRTEVPIQAAQSTFRLPNGMLVRLSEDHTRPTVRLRLRVAFDDSLLETRQKGLLSLLASLMQTGIQKDDGRQRHLVGLPMRATSAWNGRVLQVDIDTPADAMEIAFERLGTWISDPSFEEKQIEQLRSYYRTAATGDLERWTARTTFLLGLEGQTPIPLPTEMLLNRASLADMRRLQAASVLPWQTELAVVGDITKPQIEKATKAVFLKWSEGSAQASPADQAPPSVLVSHAATSSPVAAIGLRFKGNSTSMGQLLSIWITGLAAEKDNSRFALDFDTDVPKGLWRAWLAIPFRQRPDSAVTALDQWMEELAARIPSEADLEEAKRQWQTWRRSLLLHPAERLAALAAGAYPDEAAAEQVRAITLPAFQATWRACTERKARHVLLLGADEQSAKALQAMGYSQPATVQAVR